MHADRFEAAFDAAAIGMALIGLDGRPLRVNLALCRLLGRQPAEIMRATLAALAVPEDAQAANEAMRRLLAGEIERFSLERRFVVGAELVWVRESTALVRDAHRRPLHFVCSLEDISAQKHMEARLRRLADHDELTGLLNRRRFERDLAHQIELTRRYGQRAAVVMLDVDGLKRINDTRGHQAGDALISHVAGLLRSRLRVSDVLARLGGDEFAALLAEVDADGAVAVARELVRAVADQPLRLGAELLPCSASAGVAPVSPATRGPLEVIAAADRSLYDAKRGGRGHAVLNADVS